MSQEYEHEVPGTPQLRNTVFHYNPNLNTSRLVPTAEWISSSPDNGNLFFKNRSKIQFYINLFFLITGVLPFFKMCIFVDLIVSL